jgi:hypothetical protein
LVTDLVTLGSPLTHAALLMADDEDDLKARQRQRELPTNPPEAEIETRAGVERKCYSYRVWEPYPGDVRLQALHHAGFFACTRWINLYFPVYMSLFGDVVAGPLQDWFGPGIRDIAVQTNSQLRNKSIVAHTSYWHKEAQVAGGNKKYARMALIDALDLDGKNTFPED